MVIHTKPQYLFGTIRDHPWKRTRSSIHADPWHAGEGEGNTSTCSTREGRRYPWYEHTRVEGGKLVLCWDGGLRLDAMAKGRWSPRDIADLVEHAASGSCGVSGRMSSEDACGRLCA